MTNSERFVQAHKNTRKAVKENSNLNYRVQFGLELSALYSLNNKSEEEIIIEKLQAKGLQANLWEKHSMKRIYVQGFHYSKSFYIDLVEKKVVCNRPGACSDANEILDGIIDYPISDKK
jgi:hypothetical protein